MDRRGYLQLVRHDWETGEHRPVGDRGPDVGYYVNCGVPDMGITETGAWVPGSATADGVGVFDADSDDLLFVIPFRIGGSPREIQDSDTVTVTPRMESVRCPTCGATHLRALRRQH